MREGLSKWKRLYINWSCAWTIWLYLCGHMADASRKNEQVITVSLLLSPRPWDFPPSIDGDVSREDSPMELDEPKGAVSLD